MPTTQITVPSTLMDSMVQYVDVSSMTAKRALDEVSDHRQAKKRAADLGAPLLAHMLKSGVVAEHQKDAAAAMLGSHAETMQLLKSAVDKIAELKGFATKKAGDLGEGVDAVETGMAAGGVYRKMGEYNSLEDPFIGRKTNLVKESDKPFLALIGK